MFADRAKKAGGFLAALLVTGILSTSQASALVVGISGGGSASGMADLLNANGHTATYFGGVAPSAAQLSGFDAMVLVRTSGNTAVQNFVLGGGLLITEWSASSWALNTANLLDATDSGGSGLGAQPVTFTTAGVAAGLSAGLPNPYSHGGQTEFFRSLTGIGAGVDILGTRAGGAAIIGGASGLGSTLIIGYDWQDGGFDSVNNTNSEQILLNAVQYSATVVPEPGALVVFAAGLAGLGFARRKRAA
tara:strand:- start:2403 stop:3143 length:741 start_codon:yes stop_codon:yes gene_type:complete